jgi:hypothetical protein
MTSDAPTECFNYAGFRLSWIQAKKMPAKSSFALVSENPGTRMAPMTRIPVSRN